MKATRRVARLVLDALFAVALGTTVRAAPLLTGAAAACITAATITASALFATRNKISNERKKCHSRVKRGNPLTLVSTVKKECKSPLPV